MEFNGAHETLVIKEIYLIDTNILIRIKLSLMQWQMSSWQNANKHSPNNSTQIAHDEKGFFKWVMQNRYIGEAGVALCQSDFDRPLYSPRYQIR